MTLSGMTWSTKLSDGSEVELRPYGHERCVRVEECEEYLEAVVQARLHESKEALSAIRDGLASVIPQCVLSLMTWEELELTVCGKAEIDIDLLEANTEYDDDVSPDDPHIIRLWRVLRSFSHSDRSAFLRFVWARPRIPAAADFNQKFKIQGSVGDGPKGSPDTYLPKAHTCFFSLNLPRYSSDAIMAEKLRFAMYNCIEMDADFRLADSEMGGWGDIDEIAAGGGGGV
uniref:HECT domain-containing protein n=1 Tax=Octactis speculum TaxID=3111310 RepID=A0A6U3W0M3_9STRA|mmetsp:Transcript_48683/g.66315  ORF Transcript_48683/g.66315 Transcript_48683/m.66315 type:complete len:229 (+) Transcript_48683:805-1491(+)